MAARTSKATGWRYAAPAIAGVTTFTFQPYITGAMDTDKPHIPRAAQTQPTSQGLLVDERLLKAELAAVEARTDTKFTQLLGKIDLTLERISEIGKGMSALEQKVDGVDAHARSAKSTIIATVVGAAIGIVGLAFAAVAIFQSAMGTTASAYQSGLAAAQTHAK